MEFIGIQKQTGNAISKFVILSVPSTLIAVSQADVQQNINKLDPGSEGTRAFAWEDDFTCADETY